ISGNTVDSEIYLLGGQGQEDYLTNVLIHGNRCERVRLVENAGGLGFYFNGVVISKNIINNTQSATPIVVSVPSATPSLAGSGITLVEGNTCTSGGATGVSGRLVLVRNNLLNGPWVDPDGVYPTYPIGNVITSGAQAFKG